MESYYDIDDLLSEEEFVLAERSHEMKAEEDGENTAILEVGRVHKVGRLRAIKAFNLHPFSYSALRSDTMKAEEDGENTAILEPVTVVFQKPANGVGIIDRSAEKNCVEQGSKVESPLWIAHELRLRDAVSVNVPACFDEKNLTIRPKSLSYQITCQRELRSCGEPWSTKINNNVSPVVLGTKMVERVINMRKLAPPKQDEKHSPHSNLSGKSASSPDGSGFGRTLSKKSLEMAMRHMDIRRSIPGNLRPFLTNIPTSSMYSARGPTRSRTGSITGSPLATSINASSEVTSTITVFVWR